MPSAEIITIGTEIQLGEIVDTNAQFIARQLRDFGIDLYRKTTVGDNPERIADAIRHALAHLNTENQHGEEEICPAPDALEGMIQAGEKKFTIVQVGDRVAKVGLPSL